MLEINFTNFKSLTNSEKELILSWRNSDRIRFKMLNNDIITLEQHLAWIDKLKEKDDSLYYLFKVNNIPVGSFSYTNIDNFLKTCEPGSYIGNIDYKGYGILLNYLGFKHAFEELGFKDIDITVLKINKRVSQMHRTIFYAKDASKQSETEDFLALDSNTWFMHKTDIENTITKFYDNINSIEWRN